MVRGGLRAGMLATPVVAGIAFAVRGSEGALAAVAAVGIVLANFAVSGFVLEWAARGGRFYYPAMAMPSYAIRMAGVLAALAALRGVDSIDHPTFAVTFGLGVAALLAYECRLYTKTPWLALAFSPAPAVNDKETP